MDSMPLVSVITVVYNGEQYIEQTIHSVINQTYKNVEYIIIDGCSTDGTLDIVEKYKAHISYFVSEPDNGLYDAMNKGISAARGELIGMINSDDWYELNTVELMVNAYKNNPNKTIFHADRFDIDELGNKLIRRYNSSTLKFIYYGMTYNHPSMFITSSEYQKHKYNPTLRSLSDYQFVLEAFLQNKNTFCYINSPVVNYRLDGVSAQLSFYQSIKEGYQARKYAGLASYSNFISICLRVTANVAFYVKRNLAHNISQYFSKEKL